jgi:hypothetical protein
MDDPVSVAHLAMTSSCIRGSLCFSADAALLNIPCALLLNRATPAQQQQQQQQVTAANPQQTLLLILLILPRTTRLLQLLQLPPTALPLLSCHGCLTRLTLQ